MAPGSHGTGGWGPGAINGASQRRSPRYWTDRFGGTHPRFTRDLLLRSPKMPARTVADALAEALKRHGVTDIFGQSLPSALFLATPKVGIRQIAYRTENAGGTMADGYARISGRIGVVAAQNGPAATLLVPPMAEALKVSVPLLALVQDVPLANRDR